jgi:phosphate transport system substrate-binding protein
MKKPRLNKHRVVRALAALGLVAVLTPLAPAAADDDYASIKGSGSTWSQVAVEAWKADVRANGIVVDFDGVGSTYGRQQFIQGTVDFANTEIPFQNPPEPGQQAEIPKRPYAYLPIVAGGTSFMYNLELGGKRVTDLRLSAPTLAGIFTGKITRWNDPAITKDYGKALPDIAIVPIVRSDGAGASAQFTMYMRSQAASVYCPFIRSKLHLGGSTCPSVSFYPAFGASKAQSGSNGVANYVAARYGVGSIGYVEYAYAKRLGFPVASLLNKGGYYAQPSAGNVAVALTQARINANLTQNLEDVYTNRDPRTYPMSSYSYMVIPTDTTHPFNAAKGRTLSTFINYFLCGGQQKAERLGYSPLPKNLVQAGFAQVKRIPGAVASPAIDSCNNPALHILTTAAQPKACDKLGATCGGTAAPAAGGGSTSAGGSTAASGGGSGAAAAPGTVDPLTGQPVAAAGGNGAAATDPLTGQAVTGGTALASATATPVDTTAAVASDRALVWVAVLCLLLAVLAPPLLVRRLVGRP